MVTFVVAIVGAGGIEALCALLDGPSGRAIDDAGGATATTASANVAASPISPFEVTTFPPPLALTRVKNNILIIGGRDGLI